MADDETPAPEPAPDPTPETIAAGEGAMIDRATGKLRRALPGETPDATAAETIGPDDGYVVHVDPRRGTIVLKVS